MKIINSLAVGLFLVVILSVPSVSQVFSLNEILESDLITLQKTTTDRTYFTLNEEIFINEELNRGAILQFHRAKEATDRLVILDREEYMPGTISFRGYKEGNKDKIFAFTYNKGKLNGVYYDDFEAPTYFGYDKSNSKNYTSSHNERIEHRLSCGIDHSDELIPVPHFRTPGTSAKQKTAGSTTSVAAPLVASEDDSVTIDLMIVYTQAAEDWAATTGFGDIAGVIAQSVNLSQTAINNSEIGVDLRLVTTLKTSYNEETDGVGSEDRLSRLTQNDSDPVFDAEDGHNGFMQEVHGVRDTFGADIVSLFVKIEDTGGLGWRLSSSGGNPSFGFNLNRVQQIADTFTLVHEIGHNMGNAHSRTQLESSASDGGGLFHYSAGFQNTASNYHTVMAYSDGLDEAPYFSSPGLTFLGTATGQNSSTVPTDNARSMREIKRTVSNYRDTQANAPTASLLADVINVEMNREDDLTIPFQIFNDGQSVLVWDIDFGFSGNGFKRTKKAGSVIAPASFQRITKRAANHSMNNTNKAKSFVAEQTLYSTSFESGEGFSTGTFEGLSEWRAVSDDEFLIASTNSNTGSQHLRIEGDGTGNTKFISAPFFGFQQFGSYEITANFSVSSDTETFDIYVSDGKNGEFAAAIIINQGIFFAAERDEQDEVTFFGSGAATINIGSYNEIKMVMDPDNEVIRYILNGNTIYENEYVGGFSPGEMLILNRSNENGSTIDIDDIEIKQLSAPYPWLSVSESTGFTVEDASSSRSLQFTTRGVDAGTYQTTMKVRTNDPQNPSLEVPITLTVANMVSNEFDDAPVKIALDQNYPNPFNPATTISYTLREAENIRLEVFNIQGQKIATLFEGRQQAGEHDVPFDASNLSSGVYMYRLQTASQILTRQMVLIK
ncbi:MAG: zinc-dependent metalloprotease [Balneolaceae bacterium]|nr:zinc-dependent metalloprotease [Balneolaceae bacterium]MBO6545428.1 zinc-dependent metalloprotease [Balneolaceae bacterium]MBO6646824.1 zinc-dependent metalloprotease [Balneolaceae bacterium]